jgi:predicted PhzF superfamily epimerase YddE/YHI9
MSADRYRLVNVFVDEGAFSGNALAVFEDGTALDERTMQAIALQLNLSETTSRCAPGSFQRIGT